LRSEEEFRKIAGLLFSFTFTISIAITLLALLLMPLVLKIPAGFSKEALEATNVSYLILLPYLLFNVYFQHFGAVLRSQKRFNTYFLEEFIISLTLFTFTLLGLLVYKDYKILPIGVTLASFLSAIYVILRKRIHSLSFLF
ncbi:MAG: lipid II flippase MurJ, partial [Candidatus Aenigmatarchaeota archaeon]